jgi:nitroreductase
MDFDQVVRGRHSVRDFDGRTVPEKDIRAIVEEAGLAPSSANEQPWRVYVARGDVAEKIRIAHEKADMAGKSGHADVPVFHRMDYGPQARRNMDGFGTQIGSYSARAALGSREKARMGADALAQVDSFSAMALSNGRLFNAGTFVYLTLQQLAPWSLLDLGAFEQTLALAAKNLGYDSIVAYEFIRYPEEVKPVLGIPDDEVLVIGMGIGHATDATVNDLRIRRMPVDDYLTIRG